eukprot:gene10887-biopygen10913
MVRCIISRHFSPTAIWKSENIASDTSSYENHSRSHVAFAGSNAKPKACGVPLMYGPAQSSSRSTPASVQAYNAPLNSETPTIAKMYHTTKQTKITYWMDGIARVMAARTTFISSDPDVTRRRIRRERNPRRVGTKRPRIEVTTTTKSTTFHWSRMNPDTPHAAILTSISTEKRVTKM